MLRRFLIALGLSAGTASAHGIVPTEPLVEVCGGTHLHIAVEAAATTSRARQGDADTDAQVASADPSEPVLHPRVRVADPDRLFILATGSRPLDLRPSDAASFVVGTVYTAVLNGSDPSSHFSP